MAAPEVRAPGVELLTGYRAPTCRGFGPIRSALFQPVDSALWESEAGLGAGAEVRWDDDHDDEVVYVIDGELEVDGTRCGPRGVVIVESGVAARVQALSDARILHFGASSAGPPEPKGRGVHVIGPDDAAWIESADGQRGSLHYADSTCESCRVTFFENVFHGPSVVSSHTHTQDEIMRVTSGEIRLGSLTVPAGASVAIPGGARYGFRSAVSISFLNYRRDLSMYIGAPGATPIPETIESVRSVRSGEVLG